MASYKFRKVYLNAASTLSSNNEKINTKFTINDFFAGEDTSEKAEIRMQNIVIDDLLKNNDCDVIIGADLSNQIGITNKSMSNRNTSFMGVYNACASFPLELIIAGSLLGSSGFKRVACVVSSNNLSAERTYRYPIEYGIPRRETQSFTATGVVGVLISKTESDVKLESYTIGKVIDYGIKDANNMGAIMAPSAANTLIEHLKDFKREASYYDLILTGDLGKTGSKLFKELLLRHDITLKNHLDAGTILIKDEEKTKEGASGPACLPLVLCEKILKEKKYKKILIIGTGALHNTTMVNQKMTLPSISHAVSLEVI